MKAAIVFTPETLRHSEWLIPVFRAGVPAGKPERVEDASFELVDLNKQLVKRPRTTFGLRAYGESMLDDGIETGDLLIVDREATPKEGSIVVMEVDGEHTVKRLSRVGKRLWLVPGNKNLKPVELKKHQECNVWGVVMYIIKKAG